MIIPRIRAAGALALTCAVLAACGGDRPPEPPKVSDVFPRLPLPPRPTVVSRTAGAEAIQISVRSPYPSEQIEKYYLQALTRDGWRLTKQTKGRDGELILLAEQDGPPLWVRIRPEGSTATLVELAGAVVERRDTTAGAAKPTS